MTVKSAGPTSAPPLPPTRTVREGQAKSFNEKVKTAELKEAAQGNSAKSRQRMRGEAFENGDARVDEGKGDLPAGLTSMASGNAVAASAQVAEVQAGSPLPDQQAAHIERMAAAIAESLEKANGSVFSVDFGDKGQLAQSAVVSRDVAGIVTVQMVSPNANIPPAAWTALRNQLAERMERKRLSVRLKVKLQEGAKRAGR